MGAYLIYLSLSLPALSMLFLVRGLGLFEEVHPKRLRLAVLMSSMGMHGLQALVLGFLTLAGPLSLGPTTLTLLVSYLTILIALCSTPDDYLWAALVPILGLPATPAGSAFLQSEETATASWPLLTAAAVCATLTAVTLAARRTRGLPWLRPSGS